mmetsp:Transcript_513/g.1486  ORF Transcript_513/g.1486 Transcript_513/m.1486 type:complete len:387 (+) Transcript_513:77-1237(+)
MVAISRHIRRRWRPQAVCAAVSAAIAVSALAALAGVTATGWLGGGGLSVATMRLFHPRGLRRGGVGLERCRASVRRGNIIRCVVTNPDDPAKEYPSQALHPELFDPKGIEGWLEPGLLEALRAFRESGDPLQIDLAALPGVRVEAPGIVSFACLTKETCGKILSEARRFTESEFVQHPPNNMNRDGVVLNDIGLRPAFSMLFQRWMKGIGARVFGEDGVRAETLKGTPLETENWGGCTLTDHHTFVVRYAPDRDRRLDMHIDECDVTFNVGLTDGNDFEGGDLEFCGNYGTAGYRKYHHTYRHEVGRCVVHAGKRRHAVADVEGGERASLVMWTTSLSFRQTQEYKDKCGDFDKLLRPLPSEGVTPDPECVSMRHDRDNSKWSHLI